MMAAFLFFRLLLVGVLLHLLGLPSLARLRILEIQEAQVARRRSGLSVAVLGIVVAPGVFPGRRARCRMRIIVSACDDASISVYVAAVCIYIALFLGI